MKCVLLTGGSGAIGSALVPWLLKEEATAVRLLLRADSDEHLRHRLDRLRIFWQLEALPNRLEAFRGDVSQPDLGLAPADRERLRREATHIVHAAGNVKLNQTLDEARRHAVMPARHIVDLARNCRHFQKLEFVSTVGVAGGRAGLIPEEPLTAPRRFHNTYEAAKAEAEEYLRAEMQAGLPATIHRPSMVVGDSHTGAVIHFQVFYHLCELLLGRRTWGIVPDTGRFALDIIPADFAAQVIVQAVNRPETAGRTFHLCSGPEQTLRLAEWTDTLRCFFAERGQRLPRLRRLPPRWFGRLCAALAPFAPRKQGVLRAIPHFLAYLGAEQHFDNRRTLEFCASVNLRLPSPNEYLPAVLDYYWRSRSEDHHRGTTGNCAAITRSPLSLYSGRGVGSEGKTSTPVAGSPLTPGPSPRSTGARGDGRFFVRAVVSNVPRSPVRNQGQEPLCLDGVQNEASPPHLRCAADVAPGL